MKPIKLENRITFLLLNISLFLLNFKHISLLSIICGTVGVIPIIKLFDILNIYKYKITKIILLILSILSLTYYLNKISYFIGDNILREYSIIPISLTLLISIFILGNKGYHTIIKVVTIASYFILFNFIIGLLILIPYIDIGNINISILKDNNLLINTSIYILSIIYAYFLIFKISNTKINNTDLLISNSFNLITLVLINTILSILTKFIKYPYVTIFKKVNLLGFIERIEIIFSMNYLFIFYFLILFIYYQIRFILGKKFHIKRLNITLAIITFLIFLGSLIF